MSEPMRFNLKHFGQISTMEVAKDGEFVLHSDYARLKAEVERLRKAGDSVCLCLEAYRHGRPYEGKMNSLCLDNWDDAKDGKPSE